tara:strand:+ start:582 stop:1277 length:696 start_codon:yes stop_codon:yes gene_type:complete
MRQIVLDTETTGLEWIQGHKIIEIGCIEIFNRRITSKRFHQYLNPDREIELGAQQVHGISREFLQEKPRFSEIVEEFLDYIRGAELIIHNAPFDIGFLDHELSSIGGEWGQITNHCEILDTLQLARKIHPGQRNSLDALCKRYEIDNTHRTQHGALLDAELLAEVYLSMTGGQTTLELELPDRTSEPSRGENLKAVKKDLKVLSLSDDDFRAHHDTLGRISSKSDNCIWEA